MSCPLFSADTRPRHVSSFTGYLSEHGIWRVAVSWPEDMSGASPGVHPQGCGKEVFRDAKPGCAYCPSLSYLLPITCKLTGFLSQLNSWIWIPCSRKFLIYPPRFWKVLSCPVMFSQITWYSIVIIDQHALNCKFHFELLNDFSALGIVIHPA